MNRNQALEKLGYASYEDYLTSRHWKNLRKQFEGQTCFVCGNSKIQLHHRTYERLGSENHDDLVPLCQSHHSKVHDLITRREITLGSAHLLLRERYETKEWSPQKPLSDVERFKSRWTKLDKERARWDERRAKTDALIADLFKYLGE